MKAKLLNLRDALRLASILDKYIDEKTNASAEALDFVSDIIGKITPDEYLHCVNLLSGESEEEIKKRVSIEILACFVDGLRENKVLSLISFYRSLGLNK